MLLSVINDLKQIPSDDQISENVAEWKEGRNKFIRQYDNNYFYGTKISQETVAKAQQSR